ncbi:hypothetical protein AU490_01045 [Lonsdalea populi]|uniref:Uncharacterized protein n=1 Tax=Lonsdalea populi TaxID=1172565 RepID=A0A3N0UW84_9GAMM|nr:hypothetical protein AU499_00380 [Lonsdalea populi]RAT18168.1 hypothetical protein AU486_02295 [Lonsdalea quercina]RAT31035.1 hypothetical protein AU490_01045 [Lonsdalea populi]RAT40082.1 hypothetical protein AU491_00300 [Lonsdalea populi]RAT44382.1 hypothetical protein AU495_07980 [Lonsdalea populi]
MVIGVGAFKPNMAEIGPYTLAGSEVFVDDPEGAKQEAGDSLLAGVDWASVRSLIDALRDAPAAGRPSCTKWSVPGHGIWRRAASPALRWGSKSPPFHFGDRQGDSATAHRVAQMEIRAYA